MKKFIAIIIISISVFCCPIACASSEAVSTPRPFSMEELLGMPMPEATHNPEDLVLPLPLPEEEKEPEPFIEDDGIIINPPMIDPFPQWEEEGDPAPAPVVKKQTPVALYWALVLVWLFLGMAILGIWYRQQAEGTPC